MHQEFTIYPEGLKLLKDSGIEARVKKLVKSKDGLPYIGGSTFQYDIIDSVNYTKEHGYYKNIPEEFSDIYKRTMNKMLNAPEEFHWTIEKKGKTIKESCSIEDMLLFTGEMASYILTPEELWDYKRFGFESPSAFLSTVSAYIIKKSHNSDDSDSESLRKGYSWNTIRDDANIITEITGDSNADFRIFQTDVASYPTLDPFGKKILFRPKISEDKHVVAAYHSNESSMLAATLHYITQLGLEIPILNNKAQELRNYANSLTPGERFDAGGYDSNTRMQFLSWIYPIPVLDDNNNTDGNASYHLTTFGDGWYNIFVAKNNDMILSYESKETPNNPKNVIVRFAPDDMEHLLKGIVYQSIKGLGRTSPAELLDILNYRYSDKFDKDMTDYRNM